RPTPTPWRAPAWQRPSSHPRAARCLTDSSARRHLDKLVHMPHNTPVATSRAQKLHLGLAMAVAGVLYVAHSFLRFRNFESRGYDLGIFDQAIRQYSMFKA